MVDERVDWENGSLNSNLIFLNGGDLRVNLTNYKSQNKNSYDTFSYSPSKQPFTLKF